MSIKINIPKITTIHLFLYQFKLKILTSKEFKLKIINRD